MSKNDWQKLGQLIDPRKSATWWTQSYAGSSCALQRGESPLFDIYITGRDRENRSRIGHALWSAETPNQLLSIDPEPCLELGPLGSFADRGTSYPSVIKANGKYYLYFTGWELGQTVPFYNHVGLAVSETPGGPFLYFSKAPILELCDDEAYGSGSSFCRQLEHEATFELYYTCFEGWSEENGKLSHRYCIKQTRSKDGVNWERPGVYVIPNTGQGDEMIARPSMVDENELFYCQRGINAPYGIYSAVRNESGEWMRSSLPILEAGKEGEWDSREQCYAFVFRYQTKDYMLYSGNDYGKGGLGIAVR